MAARVSFDFDFKPRRWQQDCIENQKRFTVLALHRRAGKTMLSLAEAVLYSLRKPGTYVYICPFLKQAAMIAWKPLKEMLERQLKVIGAPPGFKPYTVYETDKTVRFFNGSEIKLLGADNPDAIRGSKLAGAILDEVAQMPPELWSEIVRPALSDSRGWALFIGTPKGTNLFSELFDRGNSKGYPEWTSRKYTCYETDALPPEEIESMKQEMSEEEFAREMLCDFNALATDQFIPSRLVAEAMQRTYAPGTFDGMKLVMGVDVARYGDDKSVIFLRRGKTVYDPLTFEHQDLISFGEQVITIARENGVDIINVDGTGLGGGLVDYIRHCGFACNDINFGYKSPNPECTNKRTEMYYNLRQWLQSGGSLPDSPVLKKELCAPAYEKDDQGRFVLETKKKIRTRLGFSPDLADALALTFNGYSPEAALPERMLDDYRTPRRLSPNERFERQIQRRREMPQTFMGSGVAGSWRYRPTPFRTCRSGF